MSAMNEKYENNCRTVLSLNGEWRFALDETDALPGNVPPLNLLDASIRVPGSLEEQGYGKPSKHEPIGTWKKLREYTGAAWYAKEIAIPAQSPKKRYLLMLSGARWISRVWLDGHWIGEQDSLSGEHRFDLTAFVQPGTTQQLVVKLDNRMHLPLQESHVHSYHTATNWSGITGGARIEILNESYIEETTIVPDAGARTVDVGIRLELAGSASGWQVEVQAETMEGERIASSHIAADGSKKHSMMSLKLSLGDDAQLWTDKHPVLYLASVILKKNGRVVDEYRCRFGLRSIGTQRKQITLNGSPVYLRGYVDCCIFPLTGYPVWDIEHYRRQFRIVKQYGFNHVRLHGWTAPRPFWQAADEEGMLVQTELPHWSNWYNQDRCNVPDDVHYFLRQELSAIIRNLNEHPSFMMLSLGNELINGQGHPALNEMVRTARMLDPSRLYADNTGFGDLPPYDREGDYFIPTLNWHTPYHIDYAAGPNSFEDYEAVVSLTEKPVIAHEHGQFTMYVRPSEESKYTGILRPNWLESTLETLEAKRMIGRVNEFIDASGALLVRSYKETLERARRTSGLSGVQLLDIRDFPGQGHATTGILDVFWDSKGIVDPELFRRFNDETVLVMRSPGRTFSANESHDIIIECSHFGSEPICGGVLKWELYAAGQLCQEGTVAGVNVPAGTLQWLTKVQLSVDTEAAKSLELRVVLENGKTEVKNNWEFWVYPRPKLLQGSGGIWSNVTSLKPLLSGAQFRQDLGVNWLSYVEEKEIHLAITDQLSRHLIQYVLDGGRAWLMVKPGRLHDEVDTKFLPIFWNYLWFPAQSGTTMGMIIRDHPLMSGFPHDGRSNWQWYHLVDKTPAIGIDTLPGIEPIVEVMDNFNRAKRLAYAFEARVGKGKLFVSSFRLSEGYDGKRPESAYLFQQILQYMQCDAFDPQARLSVGQLLGLFKLKNNKV